MAVLTEKTGRLMLYVSDRKIPTIRGFFNILAQLICEMYTVLQQQNKEVRCIQEVYRKLMLRWCFCVLHWEEIIAEILPLCSVCLLLFLLETNNRVCVLKSKIVCVSINFSWNWRLHKTPCCKGITNYSPLKLTPFLQLLKAPLSISFARLNVGIWTDWLIDWLTDWLIDWLTD